MKDLSFLTRECDSNERVIAVSGKNRLVPCLLTMAIVSYCGSLSQSGMHWSPCMEIQMKVWIQLKCVLILGSADLH